MSKFVKAINSNESGDIRRKVEAMIESLLPDVCFVMTEFQDNSHGWGSNKKVNELFSVYVYKSNTDPASKRVTLKIDAIDDGERNSGAVISGRKTSTETLQSIADVSLGAILAGAMSTKRSKDKKIYINAASRPDSGSGIEFPDMSAMVAAVDRTIKNMGISVPNIGKRA